MTHTESRLDVYLADPTYLTSLVFTPLYLEAHTPHEHRYEIYDSRKIIMVKSYCHFLSLETKLISDQQELG